MRISPCVAMIAAVLSNGISACGLYVPDKGLLPESNREARAIYEEKLIRHINCEIKTAITHVYTTKNVPWIREWGTAITVLITTQDQSGINPTIALLSPMANAISVFPTGGNVVTPRSTTIGLGGAFSANATRSETIQFTYLNSDLIRETKPGETCEDLQGGLAIDGNLKIADFIYDKAFIADLGNAQGHAPRSWPIYNTFTEEMIFLASFGGSITPSFRLASANVNTSGNLVAAQRTYTNDLIITIGPVKHGPSPQSATVLGEVAQSQHNAKVQASAIATAIQGQSR